MAQNFRRYIARNVTTAASTIFTADTYDTVIGIYIANTSAASINISVYITVSGADYYLIKSAPIPVGSALQVLDSGSKVVVQSGDVLKVISDTVTSADVWVSTVDDISS
jgi:hypothetical protein